MLVLKDMKMHFLTPWAGARTIVPVCFPPLCEVTGLIYRRMDIYLEIMYQNNKKKKK